MTHTYPIVGARFHPPAEALIGVMPVGTRLTLRPEPDNEYDANAIAVFVRRVEIAVFQYLLDEADNEIQLGYLPRELAATLRASGDFNGDVDGTFTISVRGNAQVRVEDQ